MTDLIVFHSDCEMRKAIYAMASRTMQPEPLFSGSGDFALSYMNAPEMVVCPEIAGKGMALAVKDPALAATIREMARRRDDRD